MVKFESIETPAAVKVKHEGREYTFWGSTDWLILRQLRALKTFYEIELLEYLRGALPNPGVIVDVGANIGNHTVYFSQVMQAQSVISIEPHHQCFDALGANCHENGCQNVTGLVCGAGATIEERYIDPTHCNHTLPDNGYNVGATQLSRTPKLPNQAKTQVIPLDGILERATGNISLIKADVEGMEMDVLLGSTKTVAAHKPWIVLEIADPDKVQHFDKHLEKSHTRIQRQFNHTPTWVFKPNA